MTTENPKFENRIEELQAEFTQIETQGDASAMFDFATQLKSAPSVRAEMVEKSINLAVTKNDYKLLLYIAGWNSKDGAHEQTGEAIVPISLREKALGSAEEIAEKEGVAESPEIADRVNEVRKSILFSKLDDSLTADPKIYNEMLATLDKFFKK